MIYIIRSDLRRAIISKGFLVGVLAMVVVIALSSVQALIAIFAKGPHVPDGYHVQLVLDMLLSDTVVLAVPIICAFPFTPAFVDDMQSGFIKQVLPRTGINAYIGGKLAACTISGGLVLSTGIVLSYVLSTIVLRPAEIIINAGAVVGPSFLALLGEVTLFFFSGMFWSLLGFTLASTTKSRYIAYASPFIVYYILIILYERYFGDCYYLYPKEWLNPSHAWFWGNWGLILVLSGLTVIVAILFTFFAKRKLSHG